MNKLIFATNNLHKLQEIREILSFCYTIHSLNDVNVAIDIPETGETFKDNALLKAETIFNLTHQNCFADDSGLSVNALHGKPGVKSARYAGEPSSDLNNRLKLLKEMQGVEDRRAAFYTTICLVMNAEKHFFEGKISGTIAHEQRGDKGFGYDPVFIPDGYEKTFAEMEPQEKNAISHRAIAVNKMTTFLLQLKQ